MNLSEKVTGAKHAPHRPSGAVGTILGDETTVTGKISSKGTLRVDGRVEGEIFSEDTVLVGPSGNIQGNVEARTVIIDGTIMGNVRASEKVEIQPQGKIQGDVFTPYGKLTIEEGARLEGKCAMSKDVQLQQSPAAPRVVDATPPKPVAQKSGAGAPTGR